MKLDQQEVNRLLSAYIPGLPLLKPDYKDFTIKAAVACATLALFTTYAVVTQGSGAPITTIFIILTASMLVIVGVVAMIWHLGDPVSQLLERHFDAITPEMLAKSIDAVGRRAGYVLAREIAMVREEFWTLVLVGKSGATNSFLAYQVLANCESLDRLMQLTEIKVTPDSASTFIQRIGIGLVQLSFLITLSTIFFRPINTVREMLILVTIAVCSTVGVGAIYTHWRSLHLSGDDLVEARALLGKLSIEELNALAGRGQIARLAMNEVTRRGNHSGSQ